ncbi:TRM-domain-containing protein [Yamadazyma tenuis ATCC 10573]|uniref:tRNA (guanine(26)-N(2))-dimethyltransferase n=2 Tax=Candida tenuis TaxID=2315449 RepID=G3BCV4_CANTC|nr:TRM-domain-containing protein [Yamadazyma tenuis ATCC 10573]EGV60217.1 TRM-domain-containing protein [Yamadazyma tenuis ATCC 10573]
MSIVKEGKAEIVGGEKVFYNHIQQFNRDLSVMVIQSWYKKYGHTLNKKRDATGEQPSNFINILEALSATGLRSIRYAKEIEHVNKVVANDLLAEAVKLIDENVEHNQLGDKVKSNCGDAIKYMSSTNQKFHVVDLDPYGTAAPFIDSALQCVKDEGILLVTCTDAGVLAGSGYPEKCYALYGGHNFGNTLIGSESNHEVGIRLILQSIASTAAKYKKTIEPLLSLSIDYYFRVFVKVKTSAFDVKELASNTMLTYHCTGCGDKHNQHMGRRVKTEKSYKYQTPKLVNVGSRCPYCESTYNLAGPMYGGRIHNREFVKQVLSVNASCDKDVYHTSERIKGMLTLALHELELPFYFNLNQLSSFFKSPPISINEFSKALGNLGYKLSLTHAKKNCIKTDAPWNVILDINKQWLIKKNNELIADYDAGNLTKTDKLTAKIDVLRQDPSTNLNLNPNMIGYKILKNLNSDTTVDFDTDNEESDKMKHLRKLKMVRYQENPKNWGPKARPPT